MLLLFLRVYMISHRKKTKRKKMCTTNGGSDDVFRRFVAVRTCLERKRGREKEHIKRKKEWETHGNRYFFFHKMFDQVRMSVCVVCMHWTHVANDKNFFLLRIMAIMETTEDKLDVELMRAWNGEGAGELKWVMGGNKIRKVNDSWRELKREREREMQKVIEI